MRYKYDLYQAGVLEYWIINRKQNDSRLCFLRWNLHRTYPLIEDDKVKRSVLFPQLGFRLEEIFNYLCFLVQTLDEIGGT
jgi:Uma2 family endonuclease